MALVTELDLPHLPVEQPDFAANQTPYVEAARQKHPWLASSNVGGYIIHGLQAAKDIIYMDDKLRPYFDGVAAFYGAENTPWGRFMADMMIASHGPGHLRQRAAFADAFTPRNAGRFRELIRSVINNLLDEWAPKGEFDFTELAAFFPITAFCGLFGVSPDFVPGIRDALETQAASTSFDKSVLPAMLAGFDRLWAFADNLAVTREAEGLGQGGLLEMMIQAKIDGKITETELRDNIIMFAAAGYDTSKNMLAVTIWLLLQHPEYWARCAEDLKFCGKAVEEALRHSSIPSVYRGVTENFEYEDVEFPAGSLLIFLMGIAGRDPAAFADPLKFDPERPQTSNRHLAFGRGAHICIGQHLARIQLEEAVHAITQRLRNPRLAGEILWRPYIGIWGLRSFPIAFDAAPPPESARV